MERIRELFTALDIYFEEVSEKEIRVVCPIDRNKDYRYLDMNTIIQDTVKTGCLTDDGSILLKENKDGSIDWLGVVG